MHQGALSLTGFTNSVLSDIRQFVFSLQRTAYYEHDFKSFPMKYIQQNDLFEKIFAKIIREIKYNLFRSRIENDLLRWFAIYES